MQYAYYDRFDHRNSYFQRSDHIDCHYHKYSTSNKHSSAMYQRKLL